MGQQHVDNAIINNALRVFNITKDQWTTYYVDPDGVHGQAGDDDKFNGLSWQTPFATIQHALDISEAGAKIYFADGTYNETLDIENAHVKLIGDTRENAIIQPTTVTDYVVHITGDQCELSRCKIVFPTGSTATAALYLASFKNQIDNIWLHNTGDDKWGVLTVAGSDEQYITNLNITGFANQMNIDGGDYHRIHDNVMTIRGSGVNIYVYNTNKCLIYDNELDGGGGGVGLDSDTNNDNVYYHNNFINHPAGHTDETDTNNLWSGNYFDDHTTDVDHSGFCDSPKGIGSPVVDYDYLPFAKFNGWKSIQAAGAGVADYTGDINIIEAFPYISNAALQAVWIEGGEAGNPTLSDTHIFGEHSMQTVVGAGGVGNIYRLITARDMTVISNINLYAQSNKVGGDSFRFTLYDSDGNYAYWTCAITGAGAWEDLDVNPSSTPSGTSATAPDLTDIVKIEFANLTASSTYLFDFVILESLVSSKIGIGYDGFDDAVENDSSVRGHLLLTANIIGAGYDAANDNPREDGSVRGHLLLAQDHIEWHEIENFSDYNDTTVNQIKADKEYPILRITESDGTVSVYRYVWTDAMAGADPDLTTGQTLITSFTADLFEVSKIFVTIDPSVINGLWDNMGAADKLYIATRYTDGVSSDQKLIPPVILRDKAVDTLASSPAVDTDLGESIVLDTNKVIQPHALIVYLRVNANIAIRTYVPFVFAVRRAY